MDIQCLQSNKSQAIFHIPVYVYQRLPGEGQASLQLCPCSQRSAKEHIIATTYQHHAKPLKPYRKSLLRKG